MAGDAAVTVDTISDETREAILRTARMHGVTGVRVFGSVARGEATAESDIDLLIDVGGTTTPWFPGGLVADLEELTGRRVDVVEAEALREPMRERILKEAVPL
jgi:predicted nucleotidyltransferase